MLLFALQNPQARWPGRSHTRPEAMDLEQRMQTENNTGASAT